MALHLNKDTVYRAAKPRDKEYFINDGGGLYLVVGKKRHQNMEVHLYLRREAKKTFVWRVSGHHVGKCQAQS